jgi:hypothetical protein
VNDFTEEEANRYLDKLGFTQDKNIRKFVFEKYGTRPSYLRDIANSKLEPGEFIEERIEDDKGKVENCFVKEGKYKEVFKEMLKKENINGVSASVLRNLMTLTVEDIAEGPAVKRNHILAFDIEKGIFKFQSNSMREATRRFIETNK